MKLKQSFLPAGFETVCFSFRIVAYVRTNDRSLAKTWSQMATFFQVMAKYPEWVKQAQLEIDSITRQARLPTLDDRKDIPIVDCIMKEVFR